MSTKIFNGYALGFSAMTPIWEIDLWAQQLRSRIGHVERQLRAKLFASTTATLIDRVCLLEASEHLLPLVNEMTGATSLSEHQSQYRVIIDHIAGREQKIRTTQQRDPLYDFECNVQVLHASGRNLLLAMLFTEQAAFRIIWRRMPGVREYAYWNNTDPPAYLTKEQWQRRERDWDKALGDEGIPSLRGFNIECQHVYGHPAMEDILGAMPTFAARARERGEDRLFHAWLAGREQTVSNYFATRSAYKQWRSTTQGRLAAVKMRHEVAAHLPQEITADLLLTSVQDLFAQSHK